MCTAILSIEPDLPVLLAGVRDEFVDRAWEPPGRYWPDFPGLIGGRDLRAGGTWLAVAPGARRAACVLNARGRMAPPGSRRSRGVLPLEAAASGKLARTGLADFDPFHLLIVEPGMAALSSWDGEHLTEQELTAGLHIVVNSGLGGDPQAGNGPVPSHLGPSADPGIAAGQRELARIGHFAAMLRRAPRPAPRAGRPVPEAWGAWLPVMNGDGIPLDDPRALIVRRDLGDGRIWGTTSMSLVAVAPDGLRYDFTGAPGDPAAWYPVAVP
jgi:Transport and Golgi organisation 2